MQVHTNSWRNRRQSGLHPADRYGSDEERSQQDMQDYDVKTLLKYTG